MIFEGGTFTHGVYKYETPAITLDIHSAAGRGRHRLEKGGYKEGQ